MEVFIADVETGAEMPTGEMGELCFRGYSCFEGYYKDPEGTAKAFDADGWFHTGDRACVDENGNLRFGGRLKDMLKVGGENVAAIEIEGYLTSHPAVAVAQVVGAPDAHYTEVPAAYVQLFAGAEATEAGADRLLRRQDRDVQGAALRPLRDRVADVGNQGAEVRAQGPDRGRTRGGRHHRGAPNRSQPGGGLSQDEVVTSALAEDFGVAPSSWSRSVTSRLAM